MLPALGSQLFLFGSRYSHHPHHLTIPLHVTIQPAGQLAGVQLVVLACFYLGLICPAPLAQKLNEPTQLGWQRHRFTTELVLEQRG